MKIIDKFKNLFGVKPKHKVQGRAELIRDRAREMVGFMQKIGEGSRADRHRFQSGVRYASAFSDKKCEVVDCSNTIGVITAGQHKRFCSDHNRKGRLERRRAQITAYSK